jgi:ABC-type uncharacterized transport system involved in gliding motility auxiliary subunit
VAVIVEKLRRYAHHLAYLGTALLVGGLGFYFVNRFWDLKAEIAVGLGVILWACFVLLRPEQVRAALTGRTARYGSNALVMSLALLGILILVNFLAMRHHRRWDVTAGSQYSLSSQTKQILAGLVEQVKITSFFRQGEPPLEEVRELLQEYTYVSDRVYYENVDPDLNPSIARQYEIRSYGTIVFERGEERHDAFGTQEQDITSGILRVSRDVQKTVYFLTGHRERDIQGFDQAGYGQAKGALEDDGYVVQTLNLAMTDTVPSEAAAVIIAAPQTPLLTEELEGLRSYFAEGGKALILRDPQRDAGLNELLADWQVAFGEGVILDPTNSLLSDAAVPLVVRYRFSQITKDLPMTFFPLACSVDDLADQDNPPSGRSFTPLLESGPRSWGETDVENPQARYDEGVDQAGPLVMGAILEQEVKGKEKTRLILFGDSDFASNGAITSVGNADLFLNSVNWLAEEEELIAIRPRPPEMRQLLLSYAQSRLVGYVSWILLPAVVLAAGAYVWWQRR